MKVELLNTNKTKNYPGQMMETECGDAVQSVEKKKKKEHPY